MESCEIQQAAYDLLVPGGLVLFEHMPAPCLKDKAAFATFVALARRLGDLVLGRNIALIRKPGDWLADAKRAVWPQPKPEL